MLEPNAEATPPKPIRRLWVVLIVLGLIGLGTFLTFVISSARNADACADAFFAAVQAGNVAEARRYATADLAASLDILEHPRAAVTDRSSMLLRMRQSKRVENIGGYGGNFSVLCGHLALDGDSGTFIVNTSAFVLLRHEAGGWRVAEVGSGAGPAICESEPD